MGIAPIKAEQAKRRPFNKYGKYQGIKMEKILFISLFLAGLSSGWLNAGVFESISVGAGTQLTGIIMADVSSISDLDTYVQAIPLPRSVGGAFKIRINEYSPGDYYTYEAIYGDVAAVMTEVVKNLEAGGYVITSNEMNSPFVFPRFRIKYCAPADGVTHGHLSRSGAGFANESYAKEAAVAAEKEIKASGNVVLLSLIRNRLEADYVPQDPSEYANPWYFSIDYILPANVK